MYVTDKWSNSIWYFCKKWSQYLCCRRVLNRKHQWHIETSELHVPDELKPSLCFKHICREVIQKHFLHINQHLHLFNTIPNLILPLIIK